VATIVILPYHETGHLIPAIDAELHALVAEAAALAGLPIRTTDS
jgi:hypothetical protein